jgi:hypothetical protein
MGTQPLGTGLGIERVNRYRHEERRQEHGMLVPAQSDHLST